MDEQNKHHMRLCVSQGFFDSLKRDRCRIYDSSGLPIPREKKPKFISDTTYFLIIFVIILGDVLSRIIVNQ